jgi:hypothetical protein
MSIDILDNHPDFLDTLVDYLWKEWLPMASFASSSIKNNNL